LVFLVFIAALWMSRDQTPQRRRAAVGKKRGRAGTDRNVAVSGAAGAVVCLLLSIQVAAAAVAVYHDAREDFSAGGRAAAFLEGAGYLDGRSLIIIYPSSSAASILPHLPRSAGRAYFVETGSFGSFTTWTAQVAASSHLRLGDILERAAAPVHRGTYARVVFVLNGTISTTPATLARLRVLRVFAESALRDGSEAFMIAEVDPGTL
jgi:hypothetical protein